MLTILAEGHQANIAAVLSLELTRRLPAQPAWKAPENLNLAGAKCTEIALRGGLK